MFIFISSINQFFESLFPGNIYIDALENFRDKMQVEHRILFDAKKLDFIDEKIRNAKDKFSVMESLFLQELPLTIYSDHMSDLVNPEQSPFVDKYIQYASNKSFDLQKAYTAKKLSEDQKQPKRQPPAPMNTLIHFYFALKNSYYIFNKIGSKIVSGTHVILIDVENLIISANVDDSGPHITTAIAYKNLRAIIKNLAHIYPNLTFILINHMDSWGDNDLLKEITTNMYIINANCETQIPCEKDDFLLMLLMQYFQETNKCSVITHDNYSWYKRGARDNFIRTTITHEHNNVSIGIHDSQLVKDFAYTLDRV